MDKYKRGEFYIICIVPNSERANNFVMVQRKYRIRINYQLSEKESLWEDRTRLARQEILNVLWNQMFPYRIHKRAPLAPFPYPISTDNSLTTW